MPKSRITSKHQTTVPKEVRAALGIGPADVLAWDLRGGAAIVSVAAPRFLARRGTVKVGRGDSVADVRRVRTLRGSAPR